MTKPVILTGIRSNEEPTLGNYLGAFLPMVQLQLKHANEYQINMFVPDLHSFTTPVDHSNLYANTLRNLKYFVAAGLDIDSSDIYIYRQSYISAHSELAWILECFTGFGEASRMVEFKDKAQRVGSESASVGLFNYPILMAADILLYGASYVPVGEDQRQHLELTRDLAVRLNNKFGMLFVVPEDTAKQVAFANRDTAPRIRSLRTPEKKMSKSVSDPAGTILLSDNPNDAAKKVMGAATDSLASIKFDWETQPGISNLIQISALLGGRTIPEVASEWEGKSSYGDLKTAVANQVKNFLTNFQIAYDAVDEPALLNKLETSESAMRDVANTTLMKVQKAIGLRPQGA